MSLIDAIYQRISDELEDVPELCNDPSEIQKFYTGKTVLLTGATGFMGKCAMEKLLRGCPDLKRIYIIVRDKRGVSATDVVTKLFNNNVSFVHRVFYNIFYLVQWSLICI